MEKIKAFLKKGLRVTKRKLRRAVVRVCRQLLLFNDWILDRRICGVGLGKIIMDMSGDEENQIGGTGTESSPYIYLKHIFSHVTLQASDRILDVGCGKGRVFAFLIKEKCPCSIDGVEHNEPIAKIAEKWTAKYPQVRVITGDAFLQDFNKYTVLTLSRPFFVNTYCAFVEKLEETLVHPVTLLSWHEDPRVRDFIKVRPGWHMEYHEFTVRVHGLYLRNSPQPFSIYTYDPEKRKETVGTDGGAEKEEQGETV